jgi:uncharacterized protein
VNGPVPVLVVSFLIGIVVGVTGMGGGALMTPALIFLGIDPTIAVANDLVAAGVNRSVGAAVHLRQGTPNVSLVKWLVLGSVPTAFAGAFIVRAVGASDQQEAFVKAAIGGALLLTAVTYTLRLLLGKRTSSALEDVPVRVVPTLVVGLVGGLLVGLTSVGAGSLMMVALLMLYPRMKATQLVGTDLLQAVPLVVAAAISHVIVSGVAWGVLLPLIAGGTPGTFLGARLAPRVSASLVRRGIVILLTLTGLALLGVPPVIVGITGIGIVALGPLLWPMLRRRRRRAGADDRPPRGPVVGRADEGSAPFEP